jgi:hypothetical protein
VTVLSESLDLISVLPCASSLSSQPILPTVHHSTAPTSWPALLQSADYLPSNPAVCPPQPTATPFVRPLSSTSPLSSTTPRHALCTPFHKPALTALVRIDLVTSTGPHLQQQRERLAPTHRHPERRKRAKLFLRAYEIFHLATSNIKHQPRPTQQKCALLWTHLHARHPEHHHPATHALPTWNSILGHLNTLK